MTTNDPQHSAVPAPPEQAPDPAAGVVLLPPRLNPAAPAGAAPGRAGHGWRRLLTLLVLALAFLTASFLARNSDLWFHLATGRLLARGEFSFGTDPFAYTTRGVYWACHAWLFDLALYGLYELGGGAILVVLKALLVTALAGLLLRVRRPAGAAWVPVVCTTLAVVAMSPRLLLQPACASYFLLGLTFWLLWRPHAEDREAGPLPWSSYLSLPLVFALWVNVDEWFLLGPALTAMFWLGERLRGQRLTPGWVVPAGLAACLLNPHTFHAFTPPAELSPIAWTSGLSRDSRFQAMFASPWQPEYLRTAFRPNAAALAYFALTLLGVASFLAHRPALRDWRLAVWFPFALLAGWQGRTIPFFAVVAAPVTALTWQDFLLERMKDEGDRAKQAQSSLVLHLSSFVLSLALVALIFLTWTGWLAGAGREGRHVAWGVQAEPSLQRVAEALSEWRRQGLLPEGARVFAVAPEAAQYAAWFAPGEKQFLDHRYQLFSGSARDYEVLCRGLLPKQSGPPAQGGERKEAGDWRRVLRENGVGVVVFYDREPQRLFAVLRRLADDPEHWTLLDLAGQALVAGWNEGGPPGAFAALAFDADRLAFGPQDEQGRALPAAPARGPEYLLPRRDFWARLTRPPARPSWESAAATTYLHYADDSEAGQRERQLHSSLSAYAASLAGLPALPAAVPQAAFQVASSRDLLFPTNAAASFPVREQLGPFFEHLVDRPPALPLLAVRAARRAVAADPADANAWLRLGQAYLSLRNLTREHSAQGMLPPLAQLRHVQVVTALEQAVRLDPDLEVARHALAYLYGERGYLDQSLEHRREEARLSRRAGPRPGETAEEYASRLALMDKDTAKLVELVQERRKAYSSGSGALQGDRAAQAGMALKLGLARQAADEILLPSPADLLGAAGIKLELDLLLSLGRAEDVRAILGEGGSQASKHRLGYYDVAPPLPYHYPAYDWLRVLAAAALGDYAEAREDLQAIRGEIRAGHDRLRQQPRDFDGAARALVPGLLAGPPPFLPAFTTLALGRVLGQKAVFEAGERILRAQQADLCVTEGLLALEQGDTGAARSVFAEAQKLCAQPDGSTVPFAGRPIAVAYLGKLNARQ
jgi:hypothetical protein